MKVQGSWPRHATNYARDTKHMASYTYINLVESRYCYLKATLRNICFCMKILLLSKMSLQRSTSTSHPLNYYLSPQPNHFYCTPLFVYCFYFCFLITLSFFYWLHFSLSTHFLPQLSLAKLSHDLHTSLLPQPLVSHSALPVVVLDS